MGGEQFAVLGGHQSPKRILLRIGKSAVLLVIAVIKAHFAQLLARQIGTRDSHRSGQFTVIRHPAMLDMKRLPRLFGLLLAADGRARVERHLAQVIEHRPAHAHLGIGGKAILGRAVMAARTFGERHQADLDEVFHFQPVPARAVNVPGGLVHHGQEIPHPARNGLLIGIAVPRSKCGVIVLHAATASGSGIRAA